ncbi:hypothetical protein MMC16_004245 [Acarospora aff. strigata]|nr:hypothetical protein [Acarospora aff. strigata]
MSSELLSEFDIYYNAPSKLQLESVPAPSVKDITGSVFDDLASLDQPVVQPSKGSFGTVEDEPRPRSWSKENDSVDMLRPSNLSHDKIEPHSRLVPSLRLKPPTLVSNRGKEESKKESDPDVLFDALEEIGMIDDEDEFGDFESGDVVPQIHVTNESPKSGRKGSIHSNAARLGQHRTERNSATLPYLKPPKQSILQERNPFEDALSVTGPVIEQAELGDASTPITAWPSFISPGVQPSATKYADEACVDDGWGAFEDPVDELPIIKDASRNHTEELIGSFETHSLENLPLPFTTAAAPSKTMEPSVMSTHSQKSAQTSSISRATWPSFLLEPAQSSAADRAEPSQVSAAPSNIPPPSVVLTLLTATLQHQCQAISSSQEHIMLEVSSATVLHDLLQVTAVAAHVIAGRKQRWKRDTLLSQNMKIGPAQSGRTGGMKLTGVDKAETLREDGEVADIVRLWKLHLGRIRSAVAAVNAGGSEISTSTSLPVLGETMPVRAAKETGTMQTATKPCAMCGLKREERVDTVDERVEDSFGEWWTEYWGHTTCKWFWDRYHDQLQQR